MKQGFQERTHAWMMECFGAAVVENMDERLHRFLEEAMELAQSLGYTSEQAMTMVDYVWRRPPGNPAQEIGGTMVCLAALCTQIGGDMDICAEVELTRCHANTDKIRAKHAAKPADVRGDYA